MDEFALRRVPKRRCGLGLAAVLAGDAIVALLMGDGLAVKKQDVSIISTSSVLLEIDLRITWTSASDKEAEEAQIHKY